MSHSELDLAAIKQVYDDWIALANESKISIGEALDVDNYAAIYRDVCKAAIPDADFKAYAQGSENFKTAAFDALPWPWKSKEEKKAPRIEHKEENRRNDEQVDVSLASIIAFSAGAPNADHFSFKLLDLLHQHIPNTTVAQLREFCAGVLKNVPTTVDHEILSKPAIIGEHDYNMWRASLQARTYKIGPYLLWPALERSGVGCQSFIHSSGRLVLEYTRCDTSIYLIDRFMVYQNKECTVEATEDHVNKFLHRLRYQQQQVAYRATPVDSYDAAMLFVATYKVTIVGGVLHATKNILKDTKNPDNFPVCTQGAAALIDLIRNAIVSGHIRGKDPLIAFDAIATWITLNVPVNVVTEGLRTTRTSIRMSVTSTIKGYVEKFTSTTDLDLASKMARLENMAGLVITPAAAVKSLSDARAIRNPGIGDVVNHNVGSVLTNNTLEWCDTYVKGSNILHFIKTHPAYKQVTDATQFAVYGVAHGHMSPLFQTLNRAKDGKSQVIFIDKAKAKGSTEVFVEGDVFSHNIPGAWIIDDSNSHDIPQSHSKNAKEFASGDHLKVLGFVRNGAPVIISKVTLASFDNVNKLTAWKSLIQDSKYSWRLVKFGRLHNLECFLIGVKSTKSMSMSDFKGELKTVSASVILANKIIMQYQKHGARAGHLSNGAGDKTPTMTVVWRALVKALPSSWPWYHRDHVVEVKHLGGTDEFESFGDTNVSYGAGVDQDVGAPADYTSDATKVNGCDYTSPFIVAVDSDTVPSYGFTPTIVHAVANGQCDSLYFDPKTQRFEEHYEDEGADKGIPRHMWQTIRDDGPFQFEALKTDND